MEYESLPLQSSLPRQPKECVNFSIQGMESVVATVSGYQGLERCRLIKLISQSGANYVGTMYQSTTHLVCWKFEGRKYEFAKKFKILVVNHRWFEECVKQRRRVPEQPYLSQSGQEIGPLLLEVPLVSANTSLFPPYQANAHNDHKGPVTDIGYETSDPFAGIRSRLLNENLFPQYCTRNNSSRKLNKRAVGIEKSLNHGCSGSRCHEEPLSSRLPQVDEEPNFLPSRQLPRQKERNVISVDPSSKRRRLVKKNVMEYFFPSDKDQKCNQRSFRYQHNDLAVSSSHSDGTSNKKNLNILGTSNWRTYGLGGTGKRSSEVDEVGDLNDVLTLCDSDVHSGDALAAAGRHLEDQGSNVSTNLERTENVTRPASTDLSCVICWTDFSSTRGVLPCGHRFCFSCIQNWADVMASKSKISTCPLCKASFVSIAKVDDAASCDQKIFSQTVPYDPSMTDVYILPDRETETFQPQSTTTLVCSECCCREPEDLLVRCHLCHIRCIHSYCLDPPLLPWTCIHCKDLRMLYHHLR
ncbi:uncharacterized protein LOC127804281 isoform X2 [Diospyros lotus]|uniref:uncharacterized protein LOC127804281 isoform X2 n=1 Tax=Diospyros lotus TaxID=55363 RepID=UPI002253F4AF|nr:uncharacterized protein LOC127804281 isoform X2 [Diospyros lotus]